MRMRSICVKGVSGSLAIELIRSVNVADGGPFSCPSFSVSSRDCSAEH